MGSTEKNWTRLVRQDRHFLNARLRKSFNFYTGLVYQRRFMINHYSATVDILTVSTDHDEQNIAYERMKHWIYHVIDDSILINEHDPDLERYRDTDARLVCLPDDPVDQYIGIMLYLKLNAIMENRMVITDIEIYSRQGDNASYLHTVGESIGRFADHNGWWTDARPIWYNPRNDKNSKVVSLDRPAEWSDQDLAWQQFNEFKKSDGVITSFRKNEDQ